MFEDREEDLVGKHFDVPSIGELWVATDVLVCSDEISEEGDGLSEFGGKGVQVEVSF